MYNLAIRKMYISTPPSPEVENFEIIIYYPAGDWTPDLLNFDQTNLQHVSVWTNHWHITEILKKWNCQTWWTIVWKLWNPTQKCFLFLSYCLVFTKQRINAVWRQIQRDLEERPNNIFKLIFTKIVTTRFIQKVVPITDKIKLISKKYLFVLFTEIQHGRLSRWIKWRASDVGEAKEGLENKLWCRWSNGRVGEWSVT